MPIPFFEPDPALEQRVSALERQVPDLITAYQTFYVPPPGWEAQYSYYRSIGFSPVDALRQVYQDIANVPAYGSGGGG